MLTVKQGCGRWGGNKPTPVRQARSRRGPREHQAAGGFMETSPCAWRWLSTSTTSSGQGERHCPVALGPDVLGSPRPLCSTGGGCWVPNPRNYSRALRAVLVALEVAGQRVGKDDETHGNGTQRGLRSVPRSPLMRLVHARGREQKTRGALIKPRASADWRRRS